MGSYTDGLGRRFKLKRIRQDVLHLVSCAIIRDGIEHHGFKSHADLRGSLGDEDPYTSKPDDQEGFWTSEGQFVGRIRANQIASDAGQCPRLVREMLSSDITWRIK